MNIASSRPPKCALGTPKGQQIKEWIYHFENKFKYLAYVKICSWVQGILEGMWWAVLNLMSFYIHCNKGTIVQRSKHSGKLWQYYETLLPDTFYIHIRLKKKDELKWAANFGLLLELFVKHQWRSLQIIKWGAKLCISRIFLITRTQIDSD